MCWWSTGVDGTDTPTIAATRGDQMPAALTTTSVSIGPWSVSTRRTARSRPQLDARDARPRPDAGAQLARRLRDRMCDGVRVEVSVARHPHGAVQRFRARRRHEPARLLGGDQLDLQPDAVRPADAALVLHELLTLRRQPQAPHRLEHAELAIQLDRVAAEPHHRGRRVEHRHQARRVARRPAGQVALLQQHDSVQPARAR